MLVVVVVSCCRCCFELLVGVAGWLVGVVCGGVGVGCC